MSARLTLLVSLLLAALPLLAVPHPLPSTPAPTFREGVVAAVITAGLFAVDADVQRFAQHNRGNTTKDIAEVVTPLGDGRFTLPPLALCYVVGRTTHDDRLSRVGAMGVESFVLAGAISSTVKFVAHRHRPSSGDGPWVWDGPSSSGSDQSFPSGHTTSAFSVATVIAGEYHEKGWVAPVAYGLATLTGLARIHDDAHWASDVFAGAAVGYLSGRAVLHWNAQKGPWTIASDGASLRVAF